MIDRMFAIRPSRRTVGAVCLAIVGLLVSGCTVSEAGERADRLASLRQERHDLIQQFNSVQTSIRRTQAAALDESGVRFAQDAFYAELRRYMEREDPAAVELLDRAEEIGGEIERLSGPVPMMTGEPVTVEVQQAVVDELAETERILRPHIQHAMSDSAVQSAFAVLQDSLITQMARIDPNATRTVDRMTEIADEIRSVDLRIAELERGP
ncbi:MAG: hypothetical protein ACWGON_03495 [Gemmatimonadota bacterium]